MRPCIFAFFIFAQVCVSLPVLGRCKLLCEPWRPAPQFHLHRSTHEKAYAVSEELAVRLQTKSNQKTGEVSRSEGIFDQGKI